MNKLKPVDPNPPAFFKTTLMHLPLQEGDFYYNENGLIVFTEQYHLRRGYCCGSSCKHCPYDHEAVPDRVHRQNNGAQGGRSSSDSTNGEQAG